MRQTKQRRFLSIEIVLLILLAFFSSTQQILADPQGKPPQRSYSMMPISAGLQAAADKEGKEADHVPHVFVRSGVIQVRIHDVTHPAYVPLESLAQVIRRYPEADQYRVTWGCFYGRHSSKATVLYDRPRRLLYYNCKGFSSPWGNFYLHSVFTEVTDRALVQDARDRKASTRELPFDDKVDFIFDDLPKYGCVRHDFPPPPQPKSILTVRDGVYTLTRGRVSMKKIPAP